MNLLVDSHVLVWLATEPEELAMSVGQALRSAANTVFFSHASVWELEIKAARQRLNLPDGWMEAAVSRGFRELPIRLDDIRTSARLPLHHRDPFDRLLVAQAKGHRFTLVTRDLLLARYDVQILPA